ncbi:MAG: methyl-accepting chemotaxis protein [Thiomicrospira sp.]
MFNRKLNARLMQTEQQLAQSQAILDALHRSMAVIEFLPDGTILTANDNFLRTVGYSLSEIVGQSHRLFVPAQIQASADYQAHWRKLSQGDFLQSRFKRQTKQGKVLWLEASYNPIFDAQGRVVKVVKFATDISDQVEKEQDAAGKINAIERVMAVIEFDLDGTILRANKNFCSAIGYEESAIVGKKHRLFVDKTYGESAEYRAFWQDLAQGGFKAGTFKRVKRNGEPLWIEASYNPVLDEQGKPIKIVKFATDVSNSESVCVLTQVMKNANAMLQNLAKGDLAAERKWFSHPRETMFDGLNKQLRDSVECLAGSLQDTVGEVVEVATVVNDAVNHVNHGTEGLRDRIHEQSAAVQQTRSSMEQVNQAIQSSSQTAKQTAALANSAQEKTNRGASVMRETIDSMAQIQRASQQIAEIVSLIDGIAFQTNLLALNAAVEAARAGEHGRGFAVVAGEVRALAQKSAEAAKDIRHLIENTVSRVDEGTRLAAQSGQVLDEVSQAINEVAGFIGDLAGSFTQQAQMIQSVHHTVSQIDSATQQNSQFVEEASEASAQLSEQAQQLQAKMAYFKLSRSSATARLLSPR